MPEKDTKPSNLERIESLLYRPDAIPRERPRGKFHREQTHVPHTWRSPDRPIAETLPRPRKRQSSVFTKIFIASLIFFIGALAVGVFTWFEGTQSSSKKVSLEILGKTFADGGEQFPVQVQITNNNNTALELADLLVEYPRGAGGNVERIKKTVGDIAPHRSVIEDFDIALFGEEGAVIPIKATLDYRMEGSNAIFSEDVSYSVTIRSTPLSFSVSVPPSTLPNQEVNVVFTVTSNSASMVNKSLVVADYPPGFDFKSALPEPSFGNNIWVFDTFDPGTEKKIVVTGSVHGVEGEDISIKGSLGTQSDRDEKTIDTVLSTLLGTIHLERAFLKASLLINGHNQGSEPINATDRIEGEIDWENTLPVRITNAVITLHLSGNAYANSMVSLNTTGFFDSASQTITWDATRNSELEVIEPGGHGSLRFSLNPAQQSLSTFTGSEPSIIFSCDVAGVIEGGSFQSAKAVDIKKAIVSSDLRLNTEAFYYSGPFINIGPMPPKVGHETTYTILWTITNTSNVVKNVRVTTILPTYISWENFVYPTNSDLTYNPITREVAWNIADISPGAGINGPAVKGGFKVGITPSLSQKGGVPQLTGDMMITGMDSFTESALSLTKRPLSTNLLNDVSSVGTNGVVVE